MRKLTMMVAIAVIVLGQGSAHADPDNHPIPTLTVPLAKTDAATSLPGVTVQRKMDPLSRSDRRVARLKKSLPGAPATLPSKDAGDRTRDYLAAHADPNTAKGEQRKMMLDAEQLPPEGVPNGGSGHNP